MARSGGDASDAAGPLEPLPDGLVAGLGDPRAYPEDESARRGVEHVQTHISHVFLTGERVYKLRKAVDHGFVRFDTRAERDADCLREVALNRRFAPDVYLGTAPLVVESGRVRVGAIGETLGAHGGEHCVVMRRLPPHEDALTLLERRRLRAHHVEAVAELVARVHEANRLGAPAPFTSDEWIASALAPVEGNFAVLDRATESVPRAALERVKARARAFAATHRARFEARRLAGRAVDGHGDLHLAHVWFERDRSEPLLIDCLEFRSDLRRIDAASDVAFLAMDLGYRGRAKLAELFLRRYAAATDDFDLYSVVDWFRSYRAAVRAKVAALASVDPGIDASQRAGAARSARKHLALAERCLASRPPGALVVVCGVVGTGKSTAAEVVADALGGAVIASDRLRKHMAGLEPTARVTGKAQRELYSAKTSDRVYARLLERAPAVLRSGRAAILDATFSRADERARALDLARREGAPALLVETRCAPAVALERLALRAARDSDASDAGPKLFARSASWFEPIDDWPKVSRLTVDTAVSGWRAALRSHPALLSLRSRGDTR